MCDPITMAAATFAIGAGQAISSYVGQQQAYKVNQQVANLNFAQQSNVLSQKQVQLDEEKSNKALDTAITTVRSQGAVSASAAGMGLSSGSIVQALNADMFGIGVNWAADETNDQNQRLQLSNERYGAQVERAGQIAKVSKPGLLDLALGIGSAAVKGAGAYSTAGGKL